MMSNFSYTNDRVFYNGLYLGEHVVWPVIYIKDYQKNWAWVHTDAIFDLWFAMKDKDWYIDDKNPLRAAMIIFLMMKESEKESVEAQEAS